MDILELSENELKKIKIKDLKKLIQEQKLFEIKKSYKKKDLLNKINEVKKEYEDSDSEEEIENNELPIKNKKIEEVIEKIEDLQISNKFEKKDITKNYCIFNSNILYDICQILKELVDHCLIIFNKDGFKIETVDKCLVSLIKVNIKNCYHSYNFIDNEYKMVIDINQMLKILDCKESNQKIKFLFEQDVLEIYYYTETESYDKFKLRLLDENLVEELNDFDISFDNKITLKSKYLSKMCTKIKKFDDKMNITINNNNLKLSSENKQIEINDILNSKSPDINVTLLLKYILIFCKTEKLSNDLEILYSDNNTPLKFLYKQDDKNDSIIEYIITPLNDDDEL